MVDMGSGVGAAVRLCSTAAIERTTQPAARARLMASIISDRRRVCFGTAVRAFFFSILGYFLTPGGVLLMGVLDASMVFFLPLGIDFVLILMTARKPELFWLYALLATAGSVVGAAGTYWIGRKAGEKGLSR